MKIKQYNGLKIIKALAMLAMLIYSYTYYYPQNFSYITPGVKFNAIGTVVGVYAVIILFTVCGFFTAQKLDEKIKPTHFAVKNIVTYYPVYLIGVVLTYAATRFYLVERILPGKTFLVNLTMLNNFINYDGWGNVDTAYKVLTYFLVFFVFVWFVLLIKQRKNLLVISVVWGIVGFVLSMVGEAFENIPLELVALALGGRYGLVFSSGIALYNITKSEKTIFSATVVAVSALFLQIGFDNWRYTAIYCIGIMLVLLTIAGGRDVEKFARSKWMQPLIGLSEIAFPVFVLQGHFGMAIMKFLCIRLPNFPGEILMVVPIAIVIFISSIIYNFLQKPLARTIEKRFEQ